MTTAAIAAPLACGFGAFVGARAARATCRNREPFADGPVSVPFALWPFAAIGFACGLGGLSHAWSLSVVAVLAVVITVLAYCAGCDLLCGILPDLATLGLLGGAIALGAWRLDVSPLAHATLVGAPFALFAFLTRGRGMGWGDVKLAAVGGALLGASTALGIYVIAALLAYTIARKARRLQQPMPFGAYLAGAIALACGARWSG